jgi:hypothetical protein
MHGSLAPTRRRLWLPSSPSSGTSPPRLFVSGPVMTLSLLELILHLSFLQVHYTVSAAHLYPVGSNTVFDLNSESFFRWACLAKSH